jgi:hypothetical protein
MPTDEENVDALFTDIVTGAQEYRLGDRTIKRASLKDVDAIKNRYDKAGAQSQGKRPYISSLKYGSDY